MMSQIEKQQTEPKDEKSKTEISIAKIGLISAIAVAAIGLLSTAVSAYFSSQTVQAPILIPIQATQTAEARSIENSDSIIATAISTQTPAVRIEHTLTHTPGISTPTATPTQLPTSLPTDTPSDWSNIFQIYTGGSCDEPVVIPSEYDIEGDPEEAIQQIVEDRNSNENEPWLIGPGGRQYISLARNIVSKNENQEWIQLSNTVRVSIRGRDTSPDHANVMMNCAGAGNKRVFPSIELDPQFNQYEVSTTYQEADFFSLQPGEFESLHFIFQCKTPGTYSVRLSMEYLYLGQPGAITIDSPDLLCPRSYSLWEIWEMPPFPSTKLGDFVWDGSGYIESP